MSPGRALPGRDSLSCLHMSANAPRAFAEDKKWGGRVRPLHFQHLQQKLIISWAAQKPRHSLLSPHTPDGKPLLKSL